MMVRFPFTPSAATRRESGGERRWDEKAVPPDSVA
jgi:hypothetical protein